MPSIMPTSQRKEEKQRYKKSCGIKTFPQNNTVSETLFESSFPKKSNREKAKIVNTSPKSPFKFIIRFIFNLFYFLFICIFKRG
jgi:hypothetical protein